MLRSPGRRPGLGHDAGAQLRPGGARRPRDGLRSRRFRRAARRGATSGPRTGGGSCSRPRWQRRPCSWWGCADPTRRSTTTTCSTTTASPIPFAMLEDESGDAHHAAAAGRPASPAAVLPELQRAGRASRSPSRSPTGCPGSARSRSRRCSPSPSSGSRPTMRPGRRPRVVRRRAGRHRDLRRRADRPPSCWGPTVPSPAARSPDADAVATFVEEIVAELAAAPRSSADARRADGARAVVLGGTPRPRARPRARPRRTSTPVTTVTATPEFLKPADGPPALHLAWGHQIDPSESEASCLRARPRAASAPPDTGLDICRQLRPTPSARSDPRGTLMAGALRAAVVRRLSPCSGGQFT